MKKLLLGLCIIGAMGLTACNFGAKSFGGTTEVKLPKGEKLINITWKDNDLWYLTKEMTDKDIAEKYEFVEKSNMGVMEGKVIIQESK